jgi:hypothetical protein
MARFCLATGFTPEIYWQLSVDEYQAFMLALKERSDQ